MLETDRRLPVKVQKVTAEQEGDEDFFNGKYGTDLDTSELYLREIGIYPLLKAEEEIRLGAEIFVARLALRNLESMLEMKMLPPEEQSKAALLLSKGTGKFLLHTLDDELKQRPKTIKEKEEKSEDASSDKKFLEDVDTNDRMLEEKCKEFLAIEDDEDKRQAISKFVKRQFDFYNQGHEAFERFANSNLRLARSWAKQYRGNGLGLKDLNGYAGEGLLIAVAKFDFRKGYKFSTFASWWIQQTIRRSIADDGSTIRLPVHVKEQVDWLRKLQGSLTQELGEEIPLEELAAQLAKTGGIRSSVETLKLALETRRILSLDKPTNNDDPDSNTLEDFIPDPNADPQNQVVEDLSKQELKKALISLLTEREYGVLALRFGLGDDGRERTLTEVGREFGVTRERIRQIEAKALRKLRDSPEFRRLFSSQS